MIPGEVIRQGAGGWAWIMEPSPPVLCFAAGRGRDRFEKEEVERLRPLDALDPGSITSSPGVLGFSRGLLSVLQPVCR